MLVEAAGLVGYEVRRVKSSFIFWVSSVSLSVDCPASNSVQRLPRAHVSMQLRSIPSKGEPISNVSRGRCKGFLLDPPPCVLSRRMARDRGRVLHRCKRVDDQAIKALAAKLCVADSGVQLEDVISMHKPQQTPRHPQGEEASSLPQTLSLTSCKERSTTRLSNPRRQLFTSRDIYLEDGIFDSVQL